MMRFYNELARRSAEHDKSKLEEPEKSGIDRSRERLWEIGYGNPGYKELRAESWGNHHESHNDHHFGFYEDGILGMTLPALVEHFCDQYAAVQTSPNGDIIKSIEHHAEMYGPVLTRIFMNTVKQWKDEEEK